MAERDCVCGLVSQDLVIGAFPDASYCVLVLCSRVLVFLFLVHVWVQLSLREIQLWVGLKFLSSYWGSRILDDRAKDRSRGHPRNHCEASTLRKPSIRDECCRLARVQWYLYVWQPHCPWRWLWWIIRWRPHTMITRAYYYYRAFPTFFLLCVHFHYIFLSLMWATQWSNNHFWLLPLVLQNTVKYESHEVTWYAARAWMRYTFMCFAVVRQIEEYC